MPRECGDAVSQNRMGGDTAWGGASNEFDLGCVEFGVGFPAGDCFKKRNRKKPPKNKPTHEEKEPVGRCRR